ncbi:MAG: peptidase M13 [Gemmatimonadota bacterium]|nr:peptidase M13 [Gemmatimonadota bacterium]
MKPISVLLRRIPAPTLALCLLAGALSGELLAQTPTKNPAASGQLGIDRANFDANFRPQDDFYRYVNGSWLRNMEIPADRARHGSFDELRVQSETALRGLIEAAAAETNRAPGSDEQKVGDLYLSFMDTARIESLGVKPLRPAIRRIASVQNRSELPNLFSELQRQGVQTPFSFSVGQDGKQATRYIAYLSQSGLGLPDRDYYLKEDAKFAETRTAYHEYIETLFRLAALRDPAGAARNIIALETRFAENHWERARNRDREATYNLRSVAELEQATPGFSWSGFLAAADAAATPAVIVRQPDYLQAMDRILTETPLETIKQYQTFKLLDDAAPFLSSPFVNAHFAFRGKTLSGAPEMRPRWNRGVGVVEGVLGEVAGRMYVEQNFAPEKKVRMQELVANLRTAFSEGIDDLEWMSPATRAEAKGKLAKFNVKIGYPDEWRDYSAMQVERDDLHGNLERASHFRYDRMVDRLGQPIARGEWGMTPQTVNAYYSSTMNEIVFPAAILQPPFFDFAADDAVNYGAIGAVIGHEISHGFDDQGSRSDGDGNLRDWWSPEDAGAFKSRTDALVEQYGAFTPLEGMNVNGRLTVGENIGDLSGLAVAYRAYRNSLGGREAPVIDGFTGDQRFFMGWAQIWRSKYREEALRNQLMTDSHSPGEYRTNGILRNMPAFYAAFGVTEGDGMYLPPEKRVKIW